MNDFIKAVSYLAHLGFYLYVLIQIVFLIMPVKMEHAAHALSLEIVFVNSLTLICNMLFLYQPTLKQIKVFKKDV